MHTYNEHSYFVAVGNLNKAFRLYVSPKYVCISFCKCFSNPIAFVEDS